MPKQYVGNGQQTGGCSVYVRDGETQYELDSQLDKVNHSPDGFQWGYAGSGPAQLAFAMLMDLYEDEVFAYKMYQQFKRDVLASLTGGEDFVISEGEIHEYFEALQ